MSYIAAHDRDVTRADAWPHDNRAAQGRLDALDPRTWRAVRRAVLVLGVLPILVLLAARVPGTADRGVVGIYGIAVVGSTAIAFYLAFVRYRDPALDITPTAIDRGAEPLVSFFIPVNNEVDNIARCIRSVLDSDYANLEVFVVNDGSDDGTDIVLDELASSDQRLHVIHLDQRAGKKAALVVAARRARGSFFVFTDSDCVLAPDAISVSIAVLRNDPELAAVSGHARALNPGVSVLTRVQDVWYDGQFAISKAAESSYGSVTCVSGPLAAFRREAIINYLPAWAGDHFLGQPFLFATDRQLTAYALGQQWIGDELKAQYADDPLVKLEDHPPRRWKVAYVRSAKVWTNVPPTYGRFIRQQVRWKKSFIRNVAFNGPWLWRRGPGAALLYYGHVLWVALAPLMAFLHLVWFPLHGRFGLTLLYVAGVGLKGMAWAGAYRVLNRRDTRWVYRPLMTVISCVVLSWLIVWAALSVRKPVWSRG